MAFWSEMKRHYANFKVAVRQKGWKVYKDGTRAYFDKGTGHPKWAGLQTPPEGGPAVMRPDGSAEYWQNGVLQKIETYAPSGETTTYFFKNSLASYAPDEQFNGMRLPPQDFYVYYASLFLDGFKDSKGIYNKKGLDFREEKVLQDGTVLRFYKGRLSSPDEETPSRELPSGDKEWHNEGRLVRSLKANGELLVFLWDSKNKKVIYRKHWPDGIHGICDTYDASNKKVSTTGSKSQAVLLSGESSRQKMYSGVFDFSPHAIFSGLRFKTDSIRLTEVFGPLGDLVGRVTFDPETRQEISRLIYDAQGSAHDLSKVTAESSQNTQQMLLETLESSPEDLPFNLLPPAEVAGKAEPYTQKIYEEIVQKGISSPEYAKFSLHLYALATHVAEEYTDAYVRSFGLHQRINWRGSQPCAERAFQKFMKGIKAPSSPGF